MDFSENQIALIIEKISGKKVDMEYFREETIDFLTNYIKPDMEVEFLKEKDDDVVTITAIVEEQVIDEDAPVEFLYDSVRCYQKFGNTMYIVPINNLNWDKLFEKIALKELGRESITKILFPEKIIEQNYNDIDLISDFNFAYELEGAFDISGYKNLLGDYNLRRVGDSSVDVDARCSNLELVYDGYQKAPNMLDYTYKIMSFLDEYDFQTNHTCGIHIHTSEIDEEESWSLYDLMKASKFYTNIEDLFYLFFPRERSTKRHCQKISISNESFFGALKHLAPQMIDNIPNLSQESVKAMLGNMWYHLVSFGDWTHEKYHDTRYCGFNIHSFFYRGTLEFRQFDADIEGLPHFLDFVDKFLNLIKDESACDLDLITREILDKENNIEKLSYLLNTLGVANSTFKFLLERAIVFNEDKFEDDVNIDNLFENHEEETVQTEVGSIGELVGDIFDAA